MIMHDRPGGQLLASPCLQTTSCISPSHVGRHSATKNPPPGGWAAQQNAPGQSAASSQCSANPLHAVPFETQLGSQQYSSALQGTLPQVTAPEPALPPEPPMPEPPLPLLAPLVDAPVPPLLPPPPDPELPPEPAAVEFFSTSILPPQAATSATDATNHRMNVFSDLNMHSSERRSRPWLPWSMTKILV